MSPIDYDEIPRHMVDARKARGWGRGKLSKESGVYLQSLRNYETGKCLPGLPNLVMIADALDKPIDEIVGRTFPERNIKQ